MSTPAPWKIEVSPSHTGFLWVAFLFVGFDYAVEASGVGGTPQEAFGRGCDALQACPQVLA